MKTPRAKRFAITLALLAATAIQTVPVAGQEFRKIELIEIEGSDTRERSVSVSFQKDRVEIRDARNSSVLKAFLYADIKAAEYSYTSNPRWKTGLGLGAASIAFPPLILVALPVAFSKHRRHWLTIRTGDDFVLLKLSKQNRLIVIPAFETKSGVTVSKQTERR